MTNENTNKSYPGKVRGKKISLYVHANLQKGSLFVMEQILILITNHICIRLRKLKKFIFLDAKSLKIFHFVMEHIIILNEIKNIR